MTSSLPAPTHRDAPIVSLLGKLARPLLLLLVLLAGGLALHHLRGAQAGLLPAIASLQAGWRGRALFLFAGTLICAVGMPRQAVCFAGGIAYGVTQGVALSLLATVAGGLIGFLWARLAGRNWAKRALEGGRAGWFARLARLARRRPFMTILTVRLLPVGSALMLSLAAGVLGLRTLPFLAATVLGSLPQTIIFVLLGSGTRIGHGLQVLLALVLFGASGVVGLSLLRRSSLAEPDGTA
jgi:uncharacterized membrane protein YdjX (TVP38/TMEM64 family)